MPDFSSLMGLLGQAGPAAANFFRGGPAPMEPDVVSAGMGNAPEGATQITDDGRFLDAGGNQIRQSWRPSILPITRDAQSGQMQFAMPKLADILGLVTGGGIGAPRGALGVGPALRKAAALPADVESRMARADEGGFYLGMPGYHGTDRSFSQFDLTKGGSTSGAIPASQGAWLSLDPAIADEFAAVAASRKGGQPQTMRLLHRADRPAQIQLTGDEQDHEIAATLADAWDRGYDAVKLKNYTSPGGKSGDILVVKDPSQLRSPSAQFDPAKRYDANLLASLGLIAGAGLGLPFIESDSSTNR